MSDMPQQPIGGRYRLVRPLGQGGQGRVWLARDEVLRRDVAIKELLPPPGLSEEEQDYLCERSMREARTIARLNQTNVVRIYDVLPYDGRPWIVMEFIASRPLHQVLRREGPMAPERAARIGLSVLAALRAAHEAGVLHRDVKPANVLLAHDGRVVLTDFGLATASEDPGMTQSGVVLGSPAYLAPERALDHPVGPASDLWSLGATLYAAVEGRSPYARTTPIATLAALTTELPPAPEHAGVLRPALEGLLRRDPEARISAAEAEHLLLQAAGDEPSLGLPLPPPSGGSSFDREVSFSNAPSQPSASMSRPSASMSRPMSGATPILDDAPKPRRSRLRIAAGALVGVAVLALGVGVVLANPGLIGAQAGAAPQQPSADPSRHTAAGWHYYRDSPGFTVPVPDGWLTVRDGRHVEFREPDGPGLLSVDELTFAPSDLLADTRTREKPARKKPGYTRIALAAVDYQVRAVEHEFTYTGPSGTPMHAITRSFVSESRRAYLIGWHTPDATWAASRPALALVLDGFRASTVAPAPAPASARPSKSAKPAPKPTRTRTTTPPPPPLAAGGQSLHNQATGTCVDVPNSDPATTLNLQTFACNGTVGQQFQLPADGTLRVLGKCVEVAGTADGSALRLATCTGGGLQRFTLNAAADLVSLQLDKCVEVPVANAGNGVRIQVVTCAGPSHQKWILG
ncbi:serine/threonine-protein kinase-like domain-containing protein [Actinoplanes friuliensis DSM 7358]|uniref:non-specific serine/threonine protein kinase n=2 Tax=Actinoplanes friuliensis TaxID=196914 RepID=U5W762_9ACTN|nr:serine/threonine-protein kinase-like domain-containing protein [Actinoplanes friuliensis DSM 7358]